MIPLTVRSYYSLMWGTRSPRDICSAAQKKGYRRLALTDTDNLYGLWFFLNACGDHGISPIVGAEITDPRLPHRAVCLVENETGYRGLCRLITRRHTDSAFTLATALPQHADGLTVLTQNPDLMEQWHGAGVFTAAALPRKPNGAGLRLKKTARYLEAPVVATPGSFFLDAADAAVHRMLRAIDLNTSLSRLDAAQTAPEDAWLAAPAEYADRFAVWPEAIRETEMIAERLAFTGPSRRTVMPPWEDASGRSAKEVLREAAYRGAARRYGHDLSETVVDRLEHELAVIRDMGFSAYFLIVQDIVSRSPRICGRGSGAASLVAYCLGITNVCPVKHDLYFERFLNPGRSDPPDIDVDFAWDERDDILDAVLARYRGHAAMVCNHVAFQPRMAVRETAKVYGLTDGEIGQISKRLPWFWRARDVEDDFLESLKHLPELRDLDFPHPWPEIIHMAHRIIGIPRHISVHSGGVVITPDPIDRYVPIQTAPKGVPILQWEKDGTEESGLVKIDLLGNRSLGVIRDAVVNLKKNGVRFDESRWEPEDDPATRRTVATGNTMGCFYIESPATRLLQQKAKVGDFEHMVIHSSIIRPAANDFIREYVRRLHGGQWAPIHPLLTDVLDETYGIMVYQEDVSKTAVALAGFSHAEADGLRKIMSKKDKGRRLDDCKTRFFSGAREKGLTEAQIEAVWNMMMSFSGYSFCKPHSASYARVSFQAAYLKTHFPAEFMAAVISNQGGFYSTFAYVSEARRMGIAVLPPDVNRSEARWQGVGAEIQTGLQAVKHLNADTRTRIVAERKRKRFKDIFDFLDRIRPEDPEARALIHAGALDGLGRESSRAALLWDLSWWRTIRRERQNAPALFEAGFLAGRPVFPPDDDKKRCRQEFAVLGFLCARHPMALFSNRLKNAGLVKAADLANHIGRRVRAAGLLITGKVVHTKNGEPMEFLTFEDETGLMETTFFPQTYRRFCAILDDRRPFILHGKVESDFGAVTLRVDRVTPVEK